MPVVFRKKSHTPSNKPEEKSDEWDKVCYTYKGKYGDVRVLVPKIDKISITAVSLSNPVCAEFDGLIPDLLGLHSSDGIFVPVPKMQRVRGYKYQCFITIPHSAERVLLQARPEGTSKAKRYFRYEFNPTRLGRSGLNALKKRLNMFGDEGNYAKLLEVGSVTRVDVAVDFINASVDELVLASSAGGKRHAYFAGEGPLETVYLGIKKGAKSSDHYAYNRRQREVDTGNKDAAKWPPTSRLEFRVMTTSRPLATLHLISNPLGRMKVFDLWSGGMALEPYLRSLFADASNFRGVTQALALLPEEIRTICAEGLNKAEEHWRPAKLWKHWKWEVEASGLLDPTSTPKPKKLKHYGKGNKPKS